MSLAWVARYLDIPYLDKGRTRDGADCWGFVCLVYAEHFGIALPRYDEHYLSSAEAQEIDAIVAREAASPLWRKVSIATAGDILFFRMGRFAAHAGLYLQAGRMLHMAQGERSLVERFDTPLWDQRQPSIYRWQGQP